MCDENIKKRCRTTNFTSDEKLLLLQIIKKYKHVIENKTSGAVSWKGKEKIWKRIESEFNSSTTVHRTVEVLKRFYNNQKKQTRKQAATNRLQVSGTGGGPHVGITSDPVYNLTMDIINKKSVQGLYNKHDDDNNRHSQIRGFRIEEDMAHSVPSCSYAVDLQNVTSDDYPTPTELDDYPPLIEIDDPLPPTENIDDPLPPTAIIDDPLPPIEVDEHPPPSEIDDHPPPPRRSRLRSINQRRPQTKLGNVALKYEEVAELKKEVFVLQRDYFVACQQGFQEKLEWEQNQRRMEEVRREEEYNFKKEEWNLKKRSLELDIEIKEAQLEVLRKCAN